ncbi:proteoglycan 4-like isoform X1 [Entelurus aequoreus]|uniref:proteoglycan 4-like isoform X1 n=1 Tax=Entelurus aequoreus TaxID=161455 RepID=UPI002B1DB357|nr:proteoglycan 4-like isoform X1 [Entelurus aequoreus]
MSLTALCSFILLACVLTPSDGQSSCRGRCGVEYYRGYMCQCDFSCLAYGECCLDFEAQCTTKNSCRGRCGETFKRGQLCSCDSDCDKYKQCCPDYQLQCEEEENNGASSVTAPGASNSCNNVDDKKPQAPSLTKAAQLPSADSEGNDEDYYEDLLESPSSKPQDDLKDDGNDATTLPDSGTSPQPTTAVEQVSSQSTPTLANQPDPSPTADTVTQETTSLAQTVAPTEAASEKPEVTTLLPTTSSEPSPDSSTTPVPPEPSPDSSTTPVPPEPSPGSSTTPVPPEPSPDSSTTPVPPEPSTDSSTTPVPPEPSQESSTTPVPPEPSQESSTTPVPPEPSQESSTTPVPTEPSQDSTTSAPLETTQESSDTLATSIPQEPSQESSTTPVPPESSQESSTTSAPQESSEAIATLVPSEPTQDSSTTPVTPEPSRDSPTTSAPQESSEAISTLVPSDSTQESSTASNAITTSIPSEPITESSTTASPETVAPDSTTMVPLSVKTTLSPTKGPSDQQNPSTSIPSVGSDVDAMTTASPLPTEALKEDSTAPEPSVDPLKPTVPQLPKPQDKPKPSNPQITTAPVDKPTPKPGSKPVDAVLTMDNSIDYQADDSNDTNLCSGRPASAITTLRNGTIAVFRGHYFWFLDRNRVPGPARGITQTWGVPSPIDTAFTRCNCHGKTYIFKGNQYWRFQNDQLEQGYPKAVEAGFDGLRGHVTAALSVPEYRKRTEAVYFFKRGGLVQKYSYRSGTSSQSCKKKPKFAIYTVRSRVVRQAVSLLGPTISIRTSWRGFPTTITSAVSVPTTREPEGYKYYVFSRTKSYNIRMDTDRPVIATTRENPSAQNSNFIKCPKTL